MDVEVENVQTTQSSKGKNKIKETLTSPPTQDKVKLDILIATSSMQNQNGIRQNDYYRYSRFAGKKINKLRKLYKLTQGKRKFNRIEIGPEEAVDSKILLVPILECERRWAKGMYLKQQLTSIGQDIKLLRHNITKKFKKAAQEAKRLFAMCKEISDMQTILEAEAYFSLMESNYLIFKRQFSEALNLLKRAANIYESISQLKDTIESITYKEKINVIKTQIRLCVYNLNTSKDIVFDEDEFMTGVTIDDEALTGKIEEIRKMSSNVGKEGESFDIKYQGMAIPIKNEKLKFSFNKIQEISNKIEEEPDLTKKVNTFTDIFNILDEIVKIIKKEKSEETQQTDNFSKIFNKLLNYVQNLRLKKYIEKNITYIKDYSQDFNFNLITEIFEKDNVKLRVKPQEMIKLYENLMEYQNQLINLEKENPDQSYLIDLNFRSKVYSVFKIFYIGLFYLLSKKYEEAYTIMHHVIERIREINENYDILNLSSISSLRDLKERTENLENLARFVITKSYVKMTKEKWASGGIREGSSNINTNVNVNLTTEANTINVKKEKPKIKFHGWLYEEMQGHREELSRENFDLFKENVKISYEDYIEAVERNNYNNYSHIIQIPPNTQLLNPKPIIYDLTFQRFQYPSLEEKMKKQEGKGLFGRALGYFFKK